MEDGMRHQICSSKLLSTGPMASLIPSRLSSGSGVAGGNRDPFLFSFEFKDNGGGVITTGDRQCLFEEAFRRLQFRR